mmetsp:Transcript_10538/g.24768  ORF Transcript_10538/g.24768 Transcript_10538/m.24768 type:complete len:91 (+) Transcript_10538:1313-1585(+)
MVELWMGGFHAAVSAALMCLVPGEGDVCQAAMCSNQSSGLGPSESWPLPGSLANSKLVHMISVPSSGRVSLPAAVVAYVVTDSEAALPLR